MTPRVPYDTVPVPRGVSFFEPKNLINIEFLTKLENILTHYQLSVAHAGLNYEKKLKAENLVGLSL